MRDAESRDAERLVRLRKLLKQDSNTPIGDVLVIATQISEEFETNQYLLIAEEAMRGIRAVASGAQPADKVFENNPRLPRKLSDMEIFQLYSIERATHELCYCCEMIQSSTEITWGGSTSTRFYLNAFYHYTSSMFLVDTSKPTHKDLPMGGKVIRALHPIGLAHLLTPIKEILDLSFGDISFGQAILNLRHSDLVHGDFSPERIEYLIRQTNMRNANQQQRFAQLIWKLFHRLLILNLNLLSLVGDIDEDMNNVVIRYLQSKTNV